jgi:hypothetical protein
MWRKFQARYKYQKNSWLKKWPVPGLTGRLHFQAADAVNNTFVDDARPLHGRILSKSRNSLSKLKRMIHPQVGS